MRSANELKCCSSAFHAPCAWRVGLKRYLPMRSKKPTGAMGSVLTDLSMFGLRASKEEGAVCDRSSAHTHFRGSSPTPRPHPENHCHTRTRARSASATQGPPTETGQGIR